MGDNFLAQSGQVQAQLQALARAAGALGADESYRDFSSELTAPWGGELDLDSQYEAAKADGPVRVAIVDAGGPDALLACPSPPSEDCPALQGAVAGMTALLEQMANDGAQSVVYFFYPDPDDGELRSKFDVLRPLMQSTCNDAPLPCAFVDLRPTFAGREAEYLLPGDLLPTDQGATATAEIVWSFMGRRCIAQ
jgi:hypothetical protein